MSRLRLSGKLALLTLAVSIPIGGLLWHSLELVTGRANAAAMAMESALLLDKMVDTQAALQRLRALTVHMLAKSSAPIEAAVRDQRQATLQALAAVDTQLAGLARLSPLNTWPGLRQRIEGLARGVHARQAAEANEQFAAAVQDLQALTRHAVDHGGLGQATGDSGRALSQAFTGQAMALAHTAAELQAAGSRLLAQPNTITLLQRSTLTGLAWSLERDLQELEGQLSVALRGQLAAPGSWLNARDIVAVLVQDTQRRMGAERPEGSAEAYFDTSDLVMEQVFGLQKDILGRLHSLAEQERTHSARTFATLVGIYAAGCLVLAYLLATFYVSFHNALRQVLQGMQATASGDLSRQVLIRGRDELAEIARAFDRMNDRLSGTTSDIRSRAARVDLSGRQVAEGSQQLAQRTDEQSHSVRSTAAAIVQITQAVSQNAKAAREVDTLTERLFVQAEEGNAAMAETMMAMDALQTSSARIGDMVAVIDDVAFHTGMLALNASVEAARAGASGKGFAVVAGEVRQLALRCAEAADEIRTLIGTSGGQLQDSSQKLQHVSVALDTLVNGVREVSGQLRVIASSSTQQSAALEEVESNIKSLESITAHNAALVEESTTASHQLVSQGQALTQSVAAMRLRHGSADEARAMVERALAHLHEVGREQALKDFNDPKGDWIDRDLFIFCLDRTGTILVNGMRPERVGNNVNSLDGLRGTHHADRMWEAADAGGAWVRYELVHPTTGQLVPKESFVKAIDEETLVSCGCYGKQREGHDARQMPAGPVAWSRERDVSTLLTA